MTETSNLRSEIKISQIENAYSSLFDKIIIRKLEVIRFKEFLENKTSWLTSPASTKFHLNIEKGLLIHSVGVTLNALKYKNAFASDLSDESVVIVSLFHDIGKVGYSNKPYYIPNTNAWEIEKGITYKINPEIVPMSLGTRSLYLVSQYISLSEEEAQAIVAHDGLYPVSGGVNNLEYFHKECRLQMIVNFADKWTAAVDEEGRK